MIVLDLMPWSTVNKPGFLRNQKLSTPNFELASEKYYRDLPDQSYCKIETALKSKLEVDNPIVVSLALDAWSAHHHGYLGIIIHYISDWNRKSFHIACVPFDERHTAQNIYKKLEEANLDWDINNKVQLCLRDNARYVTAAFNEPNCLMKSSPCLNHSLQLVIKSELFAMTSVESLIKKCRKLCTHANHSNIFYSEFYKQQEKQMELSRRLSLIQYIDTRWNSTYYMLQRFIYLKTAIAATLLEIDLDIEFSSAEWALCDKVVTCLKCFEEATKLLSSKEASICSTIPFVSTIIRALETASEDLGIMRMKNRLKGAMIERFRDIENCEHYYLSCLLDPRYKKYFFKDKSNFQHARSVLISKVANSVNSSSKCPMTFCNESTSDQDMTDQQDLSFANLMEKIIADNEVSQCTSICQIIQLIAQK